MAVCFAYYIEHMLVGNRQIARVLESHLGPKTCAPF